MNCTKVRKYLFAFADSQLSVQANCDVLDHLKMCPACSKVVQEHQAVREAIRLSAEQIRVPPLLEGRVRKAIQVGKPIRYQREPRRRLWHNGLVRVVALAACITLLVTGGLYILGGNGSAGLVGIFGGDGGGDYVIGSASDPAQITSTKVVRQHNRCCSRCELQRHQNPDLSTDRQEVAAEIRDHFNGEVLAAAPDLSGYGFDFESVNFCCPTGEQDCVAAHVMYVDYSSSRRLSFFMLPQWPEIDKGNRGISPDRLRPFVHSLSPCDDMTVLAWHENDTTYICCGLVHPEVLQNIARDIQIALGEPQQPNATDDAYAFNRP